MNFLNNTKLTRVENAAAAGTSALTTDVIDMLGYDGCTFVALLGDVTDTSVLTLTLQDGDAADGSDMVATDVVATFTAGASDADNKMLAVETFRPLKRYVRAVLTRTTANAVVDGIVAIQTAPTLAPVTQSASVLATDFGLHPEAA